MDKKSNHEEMLLKMIEERKRIKDEMDKIFTFSATDEEKDSVQLNVLPYDDKSLNGSYRLLNEGAVVDNIKDAKPRLYIKKEALKKYYNALPEDFVGYLNAEHDKNRLIGRWTKKDLSLGQDSDGRYYLDFNLNLNPELSFVKDAEILGKTYGLSVEMIGMKDSKLSKEYGFDVFEDVDIFGIGVVTNPANVASHGKLQGGKPVKDFMKKLLSAFEPAELEEMGVKIDEDKKDPEPEPEPAPQPEPEPAPAPEPVPETVPKADFDKLSVDNMGLVATNLELTKEIETLKAQIEDLNKKQGELEQNLSSVTTEKDELIKLSSAITEQFTKLKVQSKEEKTPTPAPKRGGSAIYEFYK